MNPVPMMRMRKRNWLRRFFSDANVLQFEYKGRTASLRTAAEIAAWIAERKKNYPTQAKAEAAKKESAEKKRKWVEDEEAKGGSSASETAGAREGAAGGTTFESTRVEEEEGCGERSRRRPKRGRRR